MKSKARSWAFLHLMLLWNNDLHITTFGHFKIFQGVFSVPWWYLMSICHSKFTQSIPLYSRFFLFLTVSQIVSSQISVLTLRIWLITMLNLSFRQCWIPQPICLRRNITFSKKWTLLRAIHWRKAGHHRTSSVQFRNSYQRVVQIPRTFTGPLPHK